MDHGVGRELTDALLELAWWCPEERWRALESEVNRVVGAPVDRDREPGAEQRRGPGGTCWIHVAGPHGRPPAPDGEERDVHRGDLDPGFSLMAVDQP